jgi:hypothetical protein
VSRGGALVRTPEPGRQFSPDVDAGYALGEILDSPSGRCGGRDDDTVTVNSYGLAPWPWDARAQKETATTEAIRRLFDPDVYPRVATAGVEALLADVEGPLREAALSTPLWGYESGTGWGPDFLLVDASDRVRVVVEHKRGGPANYTGLPRFMDSERFDDPLARLVELRGDPGSHVKDSPCECIWHTGKNKKGLVRSAVPQIDAYRGFRGWLTSDVSLDDPTRVLWILLDRDGRLPEVAFEDPVTASAWQTTGYKKFISVLEAEFKAASRTGRSRDADAMETALRMMLS